MQTMRGLVPALRVLLGVAFGVLVVAQVVALPVLTGRWGSSAELAAMRWPMLAVGVLELACVQVVIVCTWRLLTMAEQDRIFSEDAFTWVNTIIGAIAAGWLLLFGAFVSVVDPWRLPGLTVALALLLVGVAVLGLLLLVMRALLRQATVLRADLAAVI